MAGGLVHLQGPPIEDLSDFNGLRLARSLARGHAVAGARRRDPGRHAGCPPFPEALSRGVVDGGVITWEQAPSLRLDELTESHTDVAGPTARSITSIFFWAMNR